MVDQAAAPLGSLSGAGAGAGAGAAGLRIPEGDVRDPLVRAQCSLAVQLRRAAGSIIGRDAELTAFSQEIKSASSRLTAVTLEGEPGIGKTRLLLAAADLASAAGFTTVAVTADEEIRGPFLVARSLFAAPAIRDTAAGTPAEPAVARVVDALSGRDEPGFEHLSPEARLIRAFDLAGVALSTLAQIRPLALLIDDVQWADDDTLRMLRYAARVDADQPIFLFLTIRPDEFATVTEAVNFLADMERMGLVRRLRPGRFTQIETAELLRNVLGGPVEPASASAMQVQSEGVPFIVEELARTHREAGTLQLVDGQWKLGRNAARLVPSAVRTLIQRRAARLPGPVRDVLADAAVLGRSFSLRDLRAVRARVEPGAGAGGGGAEDLADVLRPAVEAGLLLQHPEGDAADYTFTHEQVRDFSAAQLSQSRRRQAHAAVVELLLEGGDPSPAGLPMLAQHALAAGDMERAARFSIDAAAAALHANAPEEALRLVDQALPVVSAPADRRTLLTCRDDAYAVLRRSSERLQGLAELGALSEALRDPALELDVQLRRANALRMAHDEDAAAELARRVIQRAAALGEAAVELRANLELGQAILRIPIGEAYNAVSIEVDIDGAEVAYQRAADLAEQLGDERNLAAALREVGMLKLSRLRDWFGESYGGALGFEVAGRLAAGETLETVLAGQPIATAYNEMRQILERALALFERVGDRTGVMATVIAMAYANYAPLIHMTSSARHIEEIRRVTFRLKDVVSESERARQELQMLYGVHVYARAKSVPDLMVARGEEAHRAARFLGDQATEFFAAGGVALSHLDLGEPAEAERWLALAANVASAAPTPTRARQLELWRGIVRARAGDAAGMRRHLEGAVELATSQGRAAARCEALSWLAIESARLGAESGDDDLLQLAARSALTAKDMAALLPGHPVWGPRADAALATVALARGDVPAAVGAALLVVEAIQAAGHEDQNFEILIPVAKALLAGGPPEMQAFVVAYLRLAVSRIAQATLDEAVRVRWLKGPVGRELVAIVGSFDSAGPSGALGAPDSPGALGSPDVDDVDRRLLHLLTEGHTNAEMGAELGLDEAAVGVRLAKLLARLGVSTRAEATTLAFKAFAR